MDFLKVAVIVLFVVLTILTIKIHPEIHQPMLIEDADFQLVRISDTIESRPVTVAIQPQQQDVTEFQPAPESVEIQKTPTQTIQTETQQIPVDIKVREIPTQTRIVQTTSPQIPVDKKVQEIPTQTRPVQSHPIETKPKQPKKEAPIRTTTSEPSQAELLQRLLNTDIEDTKALQENAEKLAKAMQQKPQQVQKPQQTSTHKNPYMTEQEEIIAWSKWRSDIHNQIMKDSDIGYAPYGVIFTFNFLVDKYGNVSNIKVTSIPAQYMDIARNGVKPAILRLQRKAILNFPKGTRRTSTIVNGSFTIGVQNVFSTPDQFKDFERVVH